MRQPGLGQTRYTALGQQTQVPCEDCHAEPHPQHCFSTAMCCTSLATQLWVTWSLFFMLLCIHAFLMHEQGQGQARLTAEQVCD